jgi:hypothetical protein
MRELSRVFAGQGPILAAHIARVCVLYEDLRIELYATAEPSIALLDKTDEHYRRHYFLRRCIATLFEFAEALRLLDARKEFHTVKTNFNAPLVESWDGAVNFFGKHEALLKLVRNDIGGHFGLKAAVYGVANVDPSNPEKIEVREGNVYLHFAGEIAAAATMQHLEGPTVAHKFENFMQTVVVPGFKHATKSVQCVAVAYLWERFG